MYYEMKKHTGELPLIGVNTFLSAEGSPTVLPREVIRATEEEKQDQIDTVEALKSCNADRTTEELRKIQKISIEGGNIFDALMEACKVCSLGQITDALFEVGGQYRRNM